MMSNPENNRRSKIRVDFQTRIVVDVTEPPVQMDGDSRNLSLKGIFVNTKEDISPGARCRVQIFLSGRTEPTPLCMEGTVVRKDPSGVAITFDSMDLDSYTDLKNIVRYNTENPDDVY